MNIFPYDVSEMKNDRRKQVFLGLAAVFAVIILLALIKFLQIRAIIAENAGRGAPPQSVTSHVVGEEIWPVTFDSIATLRAVQGAELAAEEAGRVSKIGFQSGSFVQEGQLLVALDTSVEDAELAGIKAKLVLSELTAKRQRALRAKNATSQSNLDKAESELLNLQAERDRLASLVRRKNILAPFAGHAGIRNVNIGQTVQVGDPIVNLQNFEQLFVDFTLPQKAMGMVPVQSKVQVIVDAYPDVAFQAVVTALDSAVNTSTRSFGLQASLDNKEGKLKPGMFARVLVDTSIQEKVLSVPASSIQYAPYGNSIYVIGKQLDKKNPLRPAEAKTVKLGRQKGDRIAVLSGLHAGDEIVSSGTFKMHPGVQVIVNNTVQPSNELAPNPEDS